jgi:pyruvate formate lyase activating enzyme
VDDGQHKPKSSPFVHPALLQEPVDGGVRCLTCERRCLLRDGQSGWCGTRQNIAGQVHTLTYGAVASLSANPIEKKPLYHFYPGTLALTAGSWGCNFDCPWCQNAGISKATPSGGRFMTPRQFVGEAIHRRCQGTSISLNEPAFSLEWSLEVHRLARQEGLYNTFVTNGYMTSQALQLLVEAGLEAMNVDIKGDAPAVRRYCGTDVEHVWRNCRTAQQAGVWLELTTLVIPSVNDRDEALEEIAGRIVADLGPGVPWHVSGYHPGYRWTAPPTPLATLERAWQVGTEAGLHHVYMGNVPGHRLENTCCPSCKALLIERQGLRVVSIRLKEGQCPCCGWAVAGRWG